MMKMMMIGFELFGLIQRADFSYKTGMNFRGKNTYFSLKESEFEQPSSTPLPNIQLLLIVNFTLDGLVCSKLSAHQSNTFPLLN